MFISVSEAMFFGVYFFHCSEILVVHLYPCQRCIVSGMSLSQLVLVPAWMREHLNRATAINNLDSLVKVVLFGILVYCVFAPFDIPYVRM